jgi:hypothetical protein
MIPLTLVTASPGGIDELFNHRRCRLIQLPDFSSRTTRPYKNDFIAPADQHRNFSRHQSVSMTLHQPP